MPSHQQLDTFVSQISYMREAVHPDITGLAMGMFAYIASHPFNEGVPMSRVVDKFGLSASTASRNMYLLSSGLVRPGESRKGFGLIRTDTAPTDRRSLQVYLTPKGQQVAKGLMQVR
jgi:DNA-binding MarR family transcriptional regulator